MYEMFKESKWFYVSNFKNLWLSPLGLFTLHNETQLCSLDNFKS